MSVQARDFYTHGMRLVLVIGPPAVGKMTVGRELARRTGLRLFHNHHTIEPLAEVFGFGTPGFVTMNGEFRRRVFEVAAAQGLDLVFTLVWDLDEAADADEVAGLLAPYVAAGADIRVVELAAPLAERLIRNRGADRIASKPTKSDLAWSDAHVRELEERHRMSSSPDREGPADRLLGAWGHIVVDTSGRSVDEVVDELVQLLDLA